MDFYLNMLGLAASCFALYFIARTKRSHFLDSSFFMGLATLGFIAYIGDATFSGIEGTPASASTDILLISIMGASVGFASYLSRKNEENIGSNLLARKGFPSKHMVTLFSFLAAVCAWAAGALLFQPWTLNQMNANGIVYYYTYQPWFIGASALLLAAFIGLPVVSFYRQSRTVAQKPASQSIKIISFCWSMFGISLFFQIAEGGLFLPISQSIGFVVDSLLFVFISFALREPTVLARIILASETVGQVVSSRSDTDTIVLYNTESDRRKLVQTFVKDGLASGQSVICRVTKSEVPFYRAILKVSDLLGPASGNKDVIIRTIETAPSLPGDFSRPSDLSSHMRELIDLDEIGLERTKEVIQNIAALDSTAGSRKTGRIWALNVDGAHAGILDLLTTRSPGSRVIDLARQQDVFSNLLGRRHQEILGERMLLEFEPASNYEEVVQKFVREFQANVEPVAIFTNAGSPVYREFNEQRNVTLFSFSTKTSTPWRISNEQVLLPERDTSLLLDAVDKLLQAHTGRRVGIVIDVLTYLILSLGFEKAYSVTSSIVEMAESGLATVIVLINPDALEVRTLSGIRGLFQSQLFFDSNGLKPLRLAGQDSEKDKASEFLSEVQEQSRRTQL